MTGHSTGTRVLHWSPRSPSLPEPAPPLAPRSRSWHSTPQRAAGREPEPRRARWLARPASSWPHRHSASTSQYPKRMKPSIPHERPDVATGPKLKQLSILLRAKREIWEENRFLIDGSSQSLWTQASNVGAGSTPASLHSGLI